LCTVGLADDLLFDVWRRHVNVFEDRQIKTMPWQAFSFLGELVTASPV